MLKRGTAGSKARKNNPLPTYKTIKDNPQMGLNNKICTDPVAFCRSKNVFLSQEDVVQKCCLFKPTIDMIGTEICRKYEDIVEWQES